MPRRPSDAVFADGRTRARPLALLPSAIGVTHGTYDSTEDVATIDSGVGILCIEGPLEHKPGWFLDYESIVVAFRTLCVNPSVQTIVLKFDSPGGECAGLNETVAILQALKTQHRKHVVGYVDESCYSAAYALAMSCDEIFMPLSAGVGSIGVITAMADVTAADKAAGYRIEVIASGEKKTDGHPHVALTDAAIKRTRKTVDKLAASFFEIVSKGRGLSVKTIEGLQAGTYSGQEAVDIGLADGILSLESLLQYAKESVNTHTKPARAATKGKNPMGLGIIAAARALASANKELEVAKSDGARALAAARVLAAEGVLAKVKKTKTVTTDTHEEEVDDGEEEASEEEEDDGEEDSSDGGEDAEEESDGKKASATTGLHTPDRLLRLCRQITGKSSIEEVMGALHATWQGSKKSRSLAAEVAQLKADAEKSKVADLIRTGSKAGKLAPSQFGWAKTQTPASLKAYLDAAPKMVRTEGEESTEAAVNTRGTGAVTAEMAKIWRKQGFAEADFPALLAKLDTNNGAR
jgi:capsid assembly protease